MNGSTENRASEASEKKSDVVMSWTTANRMLKLVSIVIEEMLDLRRNLARLNPEKRRLDREKRTLAWPDRSRRYQLQEEIEAAERKLEAAASELDALGVTLLNGEQGLVGFPTLVNDRRAYFSWKPGEAVLQYWHFAGEGSRRPVPPPWMKAQEARVAGRT